MPVHPKIKAAALAAAIVGGVEGILVALGIAVPPAVAAIINALVPLSAGYAKPTDSL